MKSFTTVAAVLLITIGWSIASAQPRGGGAGTIVDPPKPTKPKATTPVRIREVRSTIRVVTPTTGSLSVAAASNANLLVEPLDNKRAEGQEGTVPAGERIFVFNNLKPGRYRVAGVLDKHHPAQEVIVIRANKSESLTLDFPPIIYSVTINTNVSTGEIKYAPEGQPLTSVAQIVNNKVQLHLPVGQYKFEIEPSDYGYEKASEVVTLDKDRVLDVALKRNVESTTTLSANWTKAGLQEWEMPATWQESSRTLLVKGAGVALPREKGLRYYRDFKLESNVRMINGVALSFVVRARDAQNYYLVQVTGANADEPHMLRLYLVKNGVERRIMAVSFSSAARQKMAGGKPFDLYLKMVGFEIKVDIQDSDEGKPYALGILQDLDRNFAVGAVGIAARGQEENVIERFVVCTGAECSN